MLKFIALWHSCFDLLSVCFQIVFACATGNMLMLICAIWRLAQVEINNKLDRDSNVFISSPVYKKLLTCTFLTYACLLPRKMMPQFLVLASIYFHLQVSFNFQVQSLINPVIVTTWLLLNLLKSSVEKAFALPDLMRKHGSVLELMQGRG